MTAPFINGQTPCEILLGTKANPLIAALQFPFCDSLELAEKAYEELSLAMQGNDDPLWGYFPQHPDQHFVNIRPLPHCVALDKAIRETVLKHSAFSDLELAFIRLCLRDIRGKEHGGFHTDIDTGSAFVGDAKNDGTRSICKLLINLHPSETRELQYLAHTLEDLKDKGLRYDRSTYKGVPLNALPAGTNVGSVFVPPREKDMLHAVVFWADLVAHTGVDHQHGHFLAGYGGFRPFGSMLIN